MAEKELTQEELDALTQEAPEEAEAEETEEAPQISEILIQFAAPGTTDSRVIVRGLITPDQMGLAGIRLLNQAWNIWGSSLIEGIVHQVVGEMFRRMEQQAEEEQVRQMLRGVGRPN